VTTSPDIALGFDVGGTKVLAVAIDRAGSVLYEERVPTPREYEPVPGEATADAIDAMMAKALVEVQRDVADVVVGVGLPGIMSREGRVVFAANLPAANGAQIGDILRARHEGLRVVCENDADCGAVGEHELGAAQGRDNFIMVTLGTGIGGAIYLDGELRRGANGFAGEFGHVVVNVNGPRCPCGQSGCWERYASGAGLARMTHEAAAAGLLPELVKHRGGAANVRGEDVTAAALAGSNEAVAVVHDVAWWLARGLGNLATILDFDYVVIGGGLVEVASILIPRAQELMPSMVLGGAARPPFAIVPARNGERAGALGAGLVAFERLS